MTQLPPADSQSDPALVRPRYFDYALEEPAPGIPRGTLLEYWRILRQRKGAVAIFGSLGILAGLLYTLPQTPVYQARTTIEIQGLNEDFLHMRDLSPTSGNASPGDAGADIQTQVRILQTRALLNRVIQKLSLEKTPLITNPNRLEAWCNALGIAPVKAGDGRESALRAIASSLHVRAQVNTRLIEILCDSTNPRVAAEFANTLTAEFIEQNLEARWQTTQHTGAWLTRQMDDVKIKLEKSEDAMQAYARETGLVFTQEKDNVADQKLKQLQDELSKAAAERIVRQSRYEMATRASADSIGEVLDDGNLKDLQGKLTDLRRQLAELSSSFTSEHYRVKRVEAQIATLEASLESARGNILSRIRNDFESAQRREKLLAADYSASVEVATEQADKVTHYNILKREVDTSRQLYESLLQRVKEAGIASALRASNVRVVDPAVPPAEPYQPSYPDNCLLGLFGGLVAGMAFVVMRARSDRTIQQPGDAGQYLGVRELGIVHSASAGPARRRILARAGRHEPLADHATELITLGHKPSFMAESLRATLASILFAGKDGVCPRVLVLSSAGPKEGKTTLATNLAVSLAEIHRRVLLIDADLRRPRLHRIFEFDNGKGLVDLLRLADPIDGPLDGHVRSTGIPNLSLMTSGGVPSGPSDRDPNLLHSQRLPELISLVRADYDMILIDTPPMLTMADARIIARHADAVILVARANHTLRESLKEVSDRLAEDGAHVLGAVLNDWNAKKSGHYTYYHDPK